MEAGLQYPTSIHFEHQAKICRAVQLGTNVALAEFFYPFHTLLSDETYYCSPLINLILFGAVGRFLLSSRVPQLMQKISNFIKVYFGSNIHLLLSPFT